MRLPSTSRSPFSPSSTIRSSRPCSGVKPSASQISQRSARPSPSTSPICGQRRLQLLQALEEIGALLHDRGLVVALRRTSAASPAPTAVPIGLALKVEWVEPGGNTVGLISSSRAQRPDSGFRPLVIALPNTSTSGCDAEVLDRPQLAGAVEAHLDLVDHQQDAVLVEHLLQPLEEVHRRDDVAAGALDRLDVEGGVFGLPGLGVPDAVIFGLEQAGELVRRTARRTLPCSCPWGRGSSRGIRHELRAVAEMAVAAAIAVGRGDRRGAERAAVIAALEGEHQALAARGVAHELEAVLDRLGAADVEMDAALLAELRFGVLGDQGGELDLLAVQILRGEPAAACRAGASARRSGAGCA